MRKRVRQQPRRSARTRCEHRPSWFPRESILLLRDAAAKLRALSSASSMTVSLAGRTPASFEIKSANLPLVALLLKSSDLQLLEQELEGRFGDIPEFFDHDPLVIDL